MEDTQVRKRKWGRKHIAAPEGTKYCPKCKVYKPTNLFGAHNSKADRLRSWCKLCEVRKPGKHHREKSSAASRRIRYGLTSEAYKELFEKQSGVCAICGKPETKILRGTVASLSVDHDHTTGAIRGLLCAACNVAIGQFKDSISLLERAIIYLREYQ
jgi:hypothetical protein